MKKLPKLTALILIISMLACGCSEVFTDSNASSKDTSAYTLAPDPVSSQTPSDTESEETKKLREEIEGVAQIGIDDFGKVDLRVAEIKACEPIKKAKKLLKLTVFDGVKERTVASGIAKYYKPEELVGKKIILVSNLKPAKLCGVESCGMILAATCGNDIKVIFVDDMPSGAKIS